MRQERDTTVEALLAENKTVASAAFRSLRQGYIPPPIKPKRNEIGARTNVCMLWRARRLLPAGRQTIRTLRTFKILSFLLTSSPKQTLTCPPVEGVKYLLAPGRALFGTFHCFTFLLGLISTALRSEDSTNNSTDAAQELPDKEAMRAWSQGEGCIFDSIQLRMDQPDPLQDI
uniref:Uncharacterized protein n=1 Tax=Timema cristinae TaxID=61476 RepID=A0A7R9H3R6_TIMCR|nr:unnamed protein product [Timema cristinae]